MTFAESINRVKIQKSGGKWDISCLQKDTFPRRSGQKKFFLHVLFLGRYLFSVVSDNSN